MSNVKKLTPGELTQRQIDLIVLDKETAMKRHKIKEKALWQQKYLLKKGLGEKVYNKILAEGKLPDSTHKAPVNNHHHTPVPKVALAVLLNGQWHHLARYPHNIELFTDTTVFIEEDETNNEVAELSLTINGETSRQPRHLKTLLVNSERMVMVDGQALRR